MRIAITGSANVGKTTLFNALKNELPDYSFYPELAIQLIEKEPALFNDKPAFEKRLYELHKIRETDESFIEKENLIVDRCVLDTLVFSDYHNIAEYFNYERIIKELSAACYDMIFIVFPFIPFKEADKLHTAFVKWSMKLSVKGFPFIFIKTPDLKERVELILSYIENFNQIPLGCGVQHDF